jgi:hypothetical protein
MDERVDLHTHSNCSDGTLSPVELASLATARQVAMLALTDHDTVAGCAAAQSACTAYGIRFVPGIELTCGWHEREIHIVGLAIDTESTMLRAQIEDTRARRRARIAEIGRRLEKHGIAAAEPCASLIAGNATPTRMHVARLLVAGGHATNTEQAFERFLRRGQPGHVPADWPELQATVASIHAAGGLAVLAHPHRYPLSNGQLRELCGHFKDAGGDGIEVSLAGLGPADADRLASLARRYGLAGSIGSDFHEPGLPWRPLGRFAKLPDQVISIVDRLRRPDSDARAP